MILIISKTKYIYIMEILSNLINNINKKKLNASHKIKKFIDN